MIDYILSTIESIGIKLQNWAWQKRWGSLKVLAEYIIKTNEYILLR